MQRISISLFTILFVAVIMAAEEKPAKIFPYAYHMDDLPNGLRLVTVPTDFPNLVAFWAVVQTGSRNEVEPGKSGFAHFFEHMMFRGTEKYSKEEYDRLLKQAGAEGNAFTTDDYTAYHTTFFKEDLELIFKLEADRFQNLLYSVEDFKTEANAVLGEYNKNSSNPVSKLLETLREKAFDKHTYRHTTMGFVEDIRDMPNQFEYSRLFFSRYYRPEYTTLLVVGDVSRDLTLRLTKKYWGDWKKGTHVSEIPPEPAQDGPRRGHVAWPSQTLPWVLVSFKGPAYSDETKDMPTADLISSLAFSESSDLYQRLVIQEQKVDALLPYFPDHRDPYLVAVGARVKDPENLRYVEEEILKSFENLKTKTFPQRKVEEVKSNLKYSLSLRMDNSEAIADILAHYLQLRRTPETLNKLYRLYGSITPEDVQAVARKYFVPESRTIVTLTAGEEQKP